MILPKYLISYLKLIFTSFLITSFVGCGSGGDTRGTTNRGPTARTGAVGYPTSLSFEFVDIDLADDSIGGDVVVTDFEEVARVSEFQLFWGSDEESTLSDEPFHTYERNSAVGDIVVYTFEQGAKIPENATHLILQMSNGLTSSNLFGVILKDIYGPSIGALSPQSMLQDQVITPIDLVNSGSAAISCNSSPALPSGLIVTTFNDTCRISGTPLVAVSTSSYTISALSIDGGLAQTSIEIAVDIPVPAILADLPAQSFVTTVDPGALEFTNTGGDVVSCQISPDLPLGLVIANASSTCRISGTPTVAASVAIYTVTATSGDNVDANATLSLEILAANPPQLSDQGAFTFVETLSISDIVFVNSGEPTLSCQIAPNLPAGLIVSVVADSCNISGIPTAARFSQNYIVTATAVDGSRNSASVNIQVNGANPPVLADLPAQSFVDTVSIGSVEFVNTGDATVTCSSAPALPGGLSVGVVGSSCTLMGTPSVAIASDAYIFTGVAVDGTSHSVSVDIEVLAANPPVLANQSPKSFTQTLNIIPFSFSNTGEDVVVCSSVPALPTGLTLSVQSGTCEVLGSAAVAQVATTYNISATAVDGSKDTATVDLEILAAESPEIADLPPTVMTTTINVLGLDFVNSGFPADSCSVDISLPAGLSLSTFNNTCRISGTPSETLATTIFTVTATASDQTTDSATLELTISLPNPPVIPDLASQEFVDTVQVSLDFVNSGGDVIACSISPSLPSGLTVGVSDATCQISGTPLGVSTLTIYTLTATAADTTTDTADVEIEVISSNPPNLADQGTFAFDFAQPIIPIDFVNSGEDVVSCSITPALPSGLSISVVSDSCQIAGAPTTTHIDITHTVEAFAADGSADTATINLAVSQQPSEIVEKVVFTDVDTDPSEVQGSVHISNIQNETNIDEYALYWGNDSLAKVDPNPIGVFAKNGLSHTHNFVNSTAVPAGSTHLLVYTRNSTGESSFPAVTLLSDLSEARIRIRGDKEHINSNDPITVEVLSGNPGDTVRLYDGPFCNTLIDEAVVATVGASFNVPLSTSGTYTFSAENITSSSGCLPYTLDYDHLGGFTPITKVVANQSAFAAIRSNGSVMTWGNQSAGGNSGRVISQINGDNDVVEIFSNQSAFAALHADGSITTWGNDSLGGDSSSVASEVDGTISVIKIVGTSSAFAALRSDGSVVAWGLNGQGGNSSTVSTELSSGVVDIMGSIGAFAAIKSDGSVVAWGDSNSGGSISSVATELDGTIAVTDIFSNESSFAAIREDGSVIAWGNSSSGGDLSETGSALDGSFANAVSIVPNSQSYAALLDDGSVVTWGSGDFGGDSSSVSTSLQNSVSQIYATLTSFAALKTDGSVVTWGSSSSGGDSSLVSSELDGTVPIVDIFSTVAAFAVININGAVITWGDSQSGGSSSSVAGALDGTVNIVDMASSQEAFAAINSDGAVITWGSSLFGGDSLEVASDLDGTIDVVEISATNGSFAALKADGTVIIWGDKSQGGATSSLAMSLNTGSTFKEIYSTFDAFAGIRADGSVYTWGNSVNGGDSSGVVGDLDGSISVAKIFSNQSSFAALRSDGSVVAWGNLSEGGDLSTEASNLDGSVPVVNIISNQKAYMALRQDGSVISWGASTHGADTTSVDAQLDGSIKGVDIFATDAAFAVRRIDGSVISWGSTSFGGDSSSVTSDLDGTIKVISVSSTDGAFAALREDGSVIAWGDSFFGGDSSLVSNEIDGTEPVIHVFSNDRSFAALRSDGSVSAWGISPSGDTTFVSGDLDGTVGVRNIVSSSDAFAAIRFDGSVVTWGDLSHGGDSSSVSNLLDGTVAVSLIVSSKQAFAAIRTDGRVITWGNPSFGGDSTGVLSELNGSIAATNVFSNQYSNDAGGAFVALRSDGSIVSWGDSQAGSQQGAASVFAATGVENIFMSSNAVFVTSVFDSNVFGWGEVEFQSAILR